MAPPPEYDKEPKAPDKSATNISTEDSKLLNNLVNDSLTNSDHKPTNTVTAVEIENNKHVETLDDGQLKALLDEAINYKNPKDREGKSKIFKELLEEVEQESDEQACSAAARALVGTRGGRRARRGAALAHSNSLQDLVAALAAEPPRRAPRAPPAPSVSARAIGGSMPCGVDTSSLSEEPARGAGYLATVRCVNPPPLAERRVSASDANSPAEMELLNRRSKAMFPMTYTARATLEIGSGAVCSGRAVTTTTASNQVRTGPAPLAPRPPAGKPPRGPAHARHSVDDWYGSLPDFTQKLKTMYTDTFRREPANKANEPVQIRDLKHSKKHILPNIPEPKVNKDLTQIRDLKPNVKCETNPNTFSPKRIFETQSLNSLASQDEEQTLSIESYSSLERSKRKPKKHNLIVPTLCDNNPRNVRPMSIAPPRRNLPNEIKNNDTGSEKRTTEKSKEQQINSVDINSNTVEVEEIKPRQEITTNSNNKKCTNSVQNKSCDIGTSQCICDCCNISTKREQLRELIDMYNKLSSYTGTRDAKSKKLPNKDSDSFSSYVTLQQKLMEEIVALEEELRDVNSENKSELEEPTTNDNESVVSSDAGSLESKEMRNLITAPENVESNEINPLTIIPKESEEVVFQVYNVEDQSNVVKSVSDLSAELSNNAYVLLTLPSSNNTEPIDSKPKNSKKKENVVVAHTNKKEDALNKNILKVLLFENLFKNNNNEKSGMPGVSSSTNDEVDSAISFSCITTPEVVASCNTTSSSQSAVAVDPKGSLTRAAGRAAPPWPRRTPPEVPPPQPLQLGSCYRAVASVTGGAATPPARAAAAPAPQRQPDCAQVSPRSVISSSFNGLPLTRPNYGAAATSASDDYKKSLDENGNSVQGFSSPLSGSSQHKKPRRKKSSKNETVIDCQQIDGYQGDKDVNELLRFIESNADSARGAKLPRIKHKDDCDDKSKKRSSERRKDKARPPQRASSLEELSRTTLEELTAGAPPERRSWGDDARLEPDTPELTDFQTVTKKRRARRRADEPPAPRRRAPEPRRRESAPPSDRSNDSNDDLDSVHSLPDAPRTAPAPAAASYADIARTRHNIPDLIESCNYYAEGPAPRRADPPADNDYPALDPRARRRDKPRRPERAPDVLAGRPPVLLLAQPRARELDGVTFGFAVNETLLAPAPRARCDLLRDALPEPPSAVLLQIVDYVAAAWEDVVRCGGPKVRYFSE